MKNTIDKANVVPLPPAINTTKAAIILKPNATA